MDNQGENNPDPEKPPKGTIPDNVFTHNVENNNRIN